MTRDGDSFRCEKCEGAAHADVVGTDIAVGSGPMARLAALSAEHDRGAPLDSKGAFWQWTEHDWIPRRSGNNRVHSTNPALANPHVRSRGDQLVGVPTAESSPFTAGRKSITTRSRNGFTVGRK